MFTAPPFEMAVLIVLGGYVVLGAAIGVVVELIRRRRGG
jgi:hypothetical protein